jgi:hypothetical protein
VQFTSQQISLHHLLSSPATTLPQPSIMSAPIAVPDFSGKPGDEVQSGKFLKKFCTLMNIGNITNNACMNSSFKPYLKYNLLVDNWSKEQDASQMTWKALEKAFWEHFPPIQKAKKLQSELGRELCELRLLVNRLGKKERCSLLVLTLGYYFQGPVCISKYGNMRDFK